MGWLANLWLANFGALTEVGCPRPRPAAMALAPSFGGETLISTEDEEWGVVGGELDAVDSEELVEYPSSFSPSEVSIATAGMG